MYYLDEQETLNALIGGNYTYYRDEDGIADVLDDISTMMISIRNTRIAARRLQ